MAVLLAFFLSFSFALAQSLSVEQQREVLRFAWSFVHDEFYDQQFRGVDWESVRGEFEAKLPVADQAEMRTLLRQMLAKLNNSHMGVLTRDEFRRLGVVLPFFFEKREGRVFVSYVFRPKNDVPNPPITFGDEILAIDGQPAYKLSPTEVTHLDNILENPYTGAPGSVALVKLRRRGIVQTVKVNRVHRLDDLWQWELRSLPSGGIYLRLLTLGGGTLARSEIPKVLSEIDQARFLVLDVRHCVGGDASLSNVLAGLLLGPDVEIQRNLTRGQLVSDPSANVQRSVDAQRRFTGPVALLLDRNTESEPEALAAALKEYDRAVLIGSPSRGARNGFSKAASLPHGIGMIAVPYTKSISPKGNEYEGIGITPHMAVDFRITDFRRGHDPVLNRAVLVVTKQQSDNR